MVLLKDPLTLVFSGIAGMKVQHWSESSGETAGIGGSDVDTKLAQGAYDTEESRASPGAC